MTKPKKPNSGELAEAIERLRAEVAALDAEHDQAEAKCRDCAHDDALYAKARESESAVRVKREDVARRLSALIEARECAIDAELDAECERLRDASVKTIADYKQAAPKVEDDRRAEMKRHEQTLKDLEETWQTAMRAMQHAERELKAAQERQRQRRERGTTAGRKRELLERKDRAEALAAAPTAALAERGRREVAAVEAELATMETT